MGVSRPVLFAFVCLCALIPCANGTTLDRVDLTCPVCGAACSGFEITSTNTLQGRDRDFLNHADGDQPVLFLPVTCPKCYYSANTEDFQTPVSVKTKDAILVGSLLRLPSSISKEERRYQVESADTAKEIASITYIPAWARYDLMCQIMEFEGTEPAAIADGCMHAAWSVRLGENPLAPRLPEIDPGTGRWLESVVDSLVTVPDERETRSLRAIETAKMILRDLGTYPEERRRGAALAACYLLRNRGEHELLLSALPKVKTSFDPKEWNELEREIVASVTLERQYQRRARDLFESISESAGKPGKKVNKSLVYYLIGELSRRLGERDKAIACFDKVIADQGPDSDLGRWAMEQRATALKDEFLVKDAPKRPSPE